jgi:hypothetical protein
MKTILLAFLSLSGLMGNGSEVFFSAVTQKAANSNSGTVEKMIVAEATVGMNLNISRLEGRKNTRTRATQDLRLTADRDSFFTYVIFNDEVRGPLPSSMRVTLDDMTSLPAKLAPSSGQFLVEHLEFGNHYDLVVRDAHSGFVYFNVEGYEYDFEPVTDTLMIRGGRMLLSTEFAKELGRGAEAGTVVGELNIAARMRPVEVQVIQEGELVADKLPAEDPIGGVPGPDVIVGDLNGLAQFGSQAGTQVGLAVGTDSCNAGQVDLNWFANPANDHPVIPQNMYRMSGGADNTERFEQIGQSQMKHAFTALTQNLCGFGCNGVGGSRLGSGCSDPYGASLNSGPNLGSRAWVNPYTGFYPRNDSATPNNNHTGHTHLGPTHRILIEVNDLIPANNPGATYYAEAQYVTPHEYAWCTQNPGQCNMFNNVSYRRYNVTSTASPFTFSPAASTQRMKRAVEAWTGATHVNFRPSPDDGQASISYKVTNPSPGVWHYEYAIFNENLDRAISSLAIPTGAGVTVSNVGFKAPPQHPGSAADGTANSAGYSSTPWTSSNTGGNLTWATETMAQNANANAIRWGTMYNFRFDSNQPPMAGQATIGFFKTGAPITVDVQIPSAQVINNVTVSGRVTGPGGANGVRARVVMEGPGGFTRVVRSNAFGWYYLEQIPTGQTYTITVYSARYNFTPRTILVTDNVSDVHFEGTLP